MIKLIRIYKKISFVLRDTRFPMFIYTDCKFCPPCSDYAVEAINKYGASKGSILTLLRILRCSPFSKGGVDMP